MTLRRLALPFAALALTGATEPPRSAQLDLTIEGLRNAKGSVMLCLTQRSDFLECADDPNHVERVVATTNASNIEVTGLRPGTYGLLVVHDENGNGKLDKKIGIPKEGFGFSNNPKIRMGPPKWKNVAFEVKSGDNPAEIKIRYIL